MTKTVSGFLMIVLLATAQAADPVEVIDLWPDTPPGPKREVGEEQDITKPTDRLVGGRRIIKLANVATPQAHVYVARNGNSGSSVVVCPGGGYSILAWDLEGTEVAEWLNSIGVTAIVLKYRVPTRSVDPKWLQPVQDAQRAISIIRSRSKEWGLDGSRIGVLGFSAGGDTAARTALAQKRHYEPVDEFDGASCVPDAGILIYPAYLSNKEQTALQADVKVMEDAPPMFMVHAYDDPVTPASSLLLALELKRKKVPSEVHMFDTGGHGYGLRSVEGLPVTHWPQHCGRWLVRNGWTVAP